MSAPSQRSGVTLIELLIVIAIVGMLIQLLLPAVQSSRESARQTVCRNNLHQLGIAMQNHESSLGYLPSAGWGWGWIGDPDRGAGKGQPGSWAYQLLPYLDEKGVHEIGIGTKGNEKYEALAKLAGTPVSLLYCPSRRPAESTPNAGPRVDVGKLESDELFWYNAMRSPRLARTDYAANVGDRFVYWNEGPPPAEALAGEGFFNFHMGTAAATLQDINGVVIQRQPVLISQIFDGTSNTYFAGEKRVPIPAYETGKNLNDDQSSWNGDDLDTVCSAGVVPRRDPATFEGGGVPFGSAHVGGLNMLLCDGAVRFVTYDIDREVHRQFGNRRDSRDSKKKSDAAN